MGIIASSLLRALPGLADVRPGLLDIKSWILRESFHCRSLSVGRKSELYESSAGEILSSFRVDAGLVAATSIESFVEAKRKLRGDKALAWAVVKAYYASYFAAHALMRLFGYASIWGEKAHVEAIRRVSDAWQGVASGCPDRGLWRVRTVLPGTFISVDGAGRGGSGGSHEEFWVYFSEFLTAASCALATASSVVANDAQFSILRLDSLKTYVDSGRFVRCRHDINYRRGHGVWHPYVGFDLASGQASSLVTKKLLGADTECPLSFEICSDLVAAMHAARTLVSLLIEILESIDSAFPKTSSDLRCSSLRLSRQYKLI